MKKITLLISYVFLTAIFKLHAQFPVVATGLTAPIGICKDLHGNLFVAESGSGHNDGMIRMINAAGNKYTIVYGLPSFTDTSHETSGTWRPYVTTDSLLYVIQGGGPDTSAGSIMEF